MKAVILNYETLPLEVELDKENIRNFLIQELGNDYCILETEISKKYNTTICYIGNNDVTNTTHPNRVATSIDNPQFVRNCMNCRKIIVLQLVDNDYYPLSEEIASKLINIYGKKSLSYVKTLFV